MSDVPPPRYPFVPYAAPLLTDAEREERGRAFLSLMAGRRSVRDFASTPVPRALVEMAVRVAARAPSGANRQPWTFVIVDDPELKRRIREAAESEERLSYEGGRMPPEWLEALAPLGTDWRKPFLETAPYLVVVFREDYGVGRDGGKIKNYYVAESVGIACGFFIAALQSMGLATLTHTPSPMGFLRTLLKRPENEKPFILFPVGYPAADATVPDIAKKPFETIVQWNDGTTGPRELAGSGSRPGDSGAEADGLRPIDWCVRVAALAALRRPFDVRDACSRALAAGASAAALREALLMVVPYAGWPAGLNALLAFADVAPSSSGGGPDPTAVDRSALRTMGLSTARTVNEQFDRVAERVAGVDVAILDLLLESAYGVVYNRPGLSLVDRELVAVGLLAALRQHRQLLYHARGALNVGGGVANIRGALDVVAAIDPDAATRGLEVLTPLIEAPGGS